MRQFVAFVSLAALAGCQSPPQPRGVEPDETLLSVAASGRVDTRPDEARLQLGVVSVAATSGDAARANREKLDRVAATLARLGVKPDDLQTRNLSLQRIEYGKDRGGYRAENVVEVKLHDMTKVGDAVTAVTEAGANVMSGPDLRVSDPEAASRSAYAAAYKSARSRAEAYAGAAGLKVARVLAIYDGGEGAMPPAYGRGVAMDATAQSVAPPPVSAPFSAGVNTSEVRVRVDFALSD